MTVSIQWAPTVGIGADHIEKMKETARALEAEFLSEILGYAHLGEMPEGFDGGAGEVQFASLLRHEQAKLMANKGGIGLAEMIFQSMMRAEEKVKNVAN